jgi:2,3-bisphosphoglycerate-independent phosphoglycerate mutase
MPKAILVVMDGLGDRPVRELGGLTPLEAAHTPNLDALAARGITGVMNALGAMGRLTGLQVMPEIINVLGLAKLIGD